MNRIRVNKATFAMWTYVLQLVPPVVGLFGVAVFGSSLLKTLVLGLISGYILSNWLKEPLKDPRQIWVGKQLLKILKPEDK